MKDRIVTYTFGDRYLPFLWVFLYSLEKNVPDARPLVCWDDIPKKDLEYLTGRFDNAEFRHYPIGDSTTKDVTPVSIKSLFLKKFLAETDLEVIYLFDTDTLILKDPRIYWDGSVDILVTHRDSLAPINGGVIFFRNNERVRRFVDLWADKVEELAQSDEKEIRDIKQKYGGLGQAGFLQTIIGENLFDSPVTFTPAPGLKIRTDGVPCDDLNRVDRKTVGVGRVLHLKGMAGQHLLGEAPKYWGRNYEPVKLWKKYLKEADVKTTVERLK